MTKRAIKIVILFVLIIIILIGGIRMYKKLEHNKLFSATDIYSYIPPQAVEAININRAYNSENLSVYDPSFSGLLKLIGKDFLYPVLILKYHGNRKLLAVKLNHQQEADVREHIAGVALPYPSKTIDYKGAPVHIYNLPDNTFVVGTFHKGLFFISRNYKLIEDVIDTDPENSFFPTGQNNEAIEKVLKDSPVGLFIKEGGCLLALDFSTQDDAIELDGYLIDRHKKDSSIYSDPAILSYAIHFPDSLCIDSCSVSESKNQVAVKIILNKIY